MLITSHQQHKNWIIKKNGRGGEIRTPDPLVPNQMRYQAALRPELQNLYVINFQKQVNVLNISQLLNV